MKNDDSRILGTIISSAESPSTRRFLFTINKNRIVRKGQFVEIEVENGKLIGRVNDIYKTNRYYSRPETVSNYENYGKKINEIFPINEWEYLVADVSVIGVYDGNGFKESTFPPSPGDFVLNSEPEILEKFFGIDPNGLNIGKVLYHNIDAKINLTRLLQKHLAILAISGAGKSFLTSVIIEELISRPRNETLSIIIIDTHGEYTSFADDKNYAHKTKVFPADEIRIGMKNLNPHQLARFANFSGPQKREIAKIWENIKNSNFSDIIENIEQSPNINIKTKELIVSGLEDIGRTGLFGVSDYPSMKELAQQGQISIVDLSAEINMKKKQMIVSYIAKRLFEERRNDNIPPFLLIVEEAHQYIPEKAKREEALARGILQTIAREGRKFQACLCLISQRPVNLSTTVLSQCNTKIILRITNPYDLEHIGKSSEAITRDVLNQITTLPIGTGLIVGEAVNFPLFVKIRKRKSKESEKGKSLEESAKDFYEKTQQMKEDAKSFMS